MSLLGGGGVCILTHVLGGLAVTCGGIVTQCALFSVSYEFIGWVGCVYLHMYWVAWL